MIRRVALATALGVTSAAGGQMTPPRTRVFSCTDSGCHASQLDYQFLHGPTAVSACDACHDYADPEQHTFRFKRSGASLCTFCHIGHSGTEGPVVHAPMADGDCASCHNPHGATTRSLLQADSVNGVCMECHADTLSGQHLHEPAAEDCTSCHEPHTAQFPALLRTTGAELCAECHSELFTSLNSAAHPHPPAQEDCLSCHAPHASDAIRILRQEPQDLCLSCHADVGTVISAAAHPHSVVSDERSCLNCHTAHASDHAAQLLNGAIATCLECHDQPIVAEDGRTVNGVPELGLPDWHLHAPVSDGGCAECHDVHGGDLQALLVNEYPRGFYETYSEDAYSLCMSCHNPAIVEADGAEVVTRFRNGDRNLHRLHVAGDPQGRSCRSCHAVHASRNETLVAETVSFGQWQLPIGWTPTPTGGSCATGCHKLQRYDRENPVVIPTEDGMPLDTPAGANQDPSSEEAGEQR